MYAMCRVSRDALRDLPGFASEPTQMPVHTEGRAPLPSLLLTASPCEKQTNLTARIRADRRPAPLWGGTGLGFVQAGRTDYLRIMLRWRHVPPRVDRRAEDCSARCMRLVQFRISF